MFSTQRSFALSYKIVASPSVPRSSVIPPPFELAAFVLPSPKTKFRSSTLNVVLLMVVVTPSTCKLPAIITVPVLSPCPSGSSVNAAGPFSVPVI